MKVKKGKPVSPGIGIGKAFLLESEGLKIPASYITEGYAEQEIQRLESAAEDVVEDLCQLAEKLRKGVGAGIAEVCIAHAGILKDGALKREFYNGIKQKHYTAEFSVASTMRRYRERFIKNDFPGKHITGLDDLESRLLRNLLSGECQSLRDLKDGVVLVSRCLLPLHIASAKTDKIMGIATDSNGATSHAAVIAASYGIPAVVGLRDITSSVAGSDTLIINGSSGEVLIEPDKYICVRYSDKKLKQEKSQMVLAEKMRHLPAKTPDGRHFLSLKVNIEAPSAIPEALKYGAEGVGLFRTDFLFLKYGKTPTAEQHFHFYMKALKQLGGRPVAIRTFDPRAILPPVAYPLQRNKNQFAGLCSLRYCLNNPDGFKPQIRAILKASYFGNVRLIFPMVSGIDELKEAESVLEEVKEEMNEFEEPYDPGMPVGITIDLPGAAICADKLSEHCDFFSIGTDDLIQYTLGSDRTGHNASSLYRPEHQAVLRLIERSIQAGQKAGIPVGVCGEMASNPFYTPLFIAMGPESLSLAPSQKLPDIKKTIRSIKFSEARELTGRVLNAKHPASARELLMEANKNFLN